MDRVVKLFADKFSRIITAQTFSQKILKNQHVKVIKFLKLLGTL